MVRYKSPADRLKNMQSAKVRKNINVTSHKNDGIFSDIGSPERVMSPKVNRQRNFGKSALSKSLVQKDNLNT
jgi:hypothetical protein